MPAEVNEAWLRVRSVAGEQTIAQNERFGSQ